ncbi:MAG: 16S rRNA (adenine(1518)-N(6)/adenine(1519)-N(6))-dimethyltransferase RsmA [Candidatus Omnitrophota bacterium]
MLTKTQIVALSKEHDFYLRKSLGQNFLIDRNLRDKIVRLLELKREEAVLEIGPGLGALTEPLAESSGRVWAVEKDRKLYGLVSSLLSRYENLTVAQGDILDFDIGALPGGKIKVVGALPFYITTPILEKLFENRQRIEEIYIIIQKEVALRLAAGPGEDDYSSLSLFAQFYCDIKKLLDIRRKAFFPEPKVDSALLRLRVLSRPSVTVRDEAALFRTIRRAFSQRRKTILSSLSGKGAMGVSKDRMRGMLEVLGVDPKSRAETLALGDFARISEAIAEVDRGIDI